VCQIQIWSLLERPIIMNLQYWFIPSFLIVCWAYFRISKTVEFRCITLKHVLVVKAKLRSSSWWIRYFVQTSLEENEAVVKKFDQAAAKWSYRPDCQVFHLKSYSWESQNCTFCKLIPPMPVLFCTKCLVYSLN